VDLAGFVAQHDEMARRTLVTVESFTPDDQDSAPLSAPAGTTATGIEVGVNGSRSAVAAYLAGLATLPRRVAVDQVEQTDEGADLVSLRVRLRIFSVVAATR
jgi:hypothetical protein